MFDKLKDRYIFAMCVLLVILIVFSVQIYNLVGKGDSSAFTAGSSVTLPVNGKRGSIYDRNGVLLAYDKESYNVNLYINPENNASSDRAHYTQVIIDTISIIEKNGDSISTSLLIKKNEDGEFVYDISDELTEEQRQRRIDLWCSNMQIGDPSMEPKDLYFDLRSRFRIPEHCTYEEAVKILSIWQEVQNNMYQSYRMITIATDVSLETVYEIEARLDSLSGISIGTSYIREYPKNDTAAHILGYLGRIVDAEELAEKKKDGYSEDDLIGQIGIESSMEKYLTASTTDKQGSKTYRLNSAGAIDKIIGMSSPKQGSDVILTIDIGLQEVAEEALAQNVKKIRREQEADYAKNPTKYNVLLAQRSKDTLSMANAGAAIVMEVKTGNVLALASYPSYDLNLFTGGITTENYEMLKNTEGSPLFNNAISSTSTPGSIFKMATSIAGLMEGVVDVNTHIVDSGPYDKYVQDGYTAPACWVKPHYSKHGSQTVVEALKNSCNYYFFEVADRLGIENLTKWVDKLGLTSKTGIQLTGEAVGWIGGPSIYYDSSKPINQQKTSKPILVYNKLVKQLKKYGEERDVSYSDDQLDKAALALIKLVEKQSLSIGPDIRQVLSDTLDIPTNVTFSRGWTNEIMSSLIDLIWTPTDTATQGIGATPSQFTPIEIARYLCAIGNGGKVFTANIIDTVVDSKGSVLLKGQSELVEDIKLEKRYYDAIIEGMEQVVSWENRGTAGSAFAGFKYQNLLAGKTGTAPISNIGMEDNIWLCLLAPKDDPEIAVVIFVPNGLSNCKVYDTAKAIITYYFDTKAANQ